MKKKYFNILERMTIRREKNWSAEWEWKEINKLNKQIKKRINK